MANKLKRDYKKEWKKEKETKTSRLIKIDKVLYEQLDKKLKKENKNFTGLVMDAIYKFLDEKK